MRKLLIVLPIMIFFATLVIASQHNNDNGRIIYIANESTVNFIGDDSSLSITKFIFHTWNDNTEGRLFIVGETTSGEKVILNIRFKDGEGSGTYKVGGEVQTVSFDINVFTPPPETIGVTFYRCDEVTRTCIIVGGTIVHHGLTISGTGDLDFEVNEIWTERLDNSEVV